MTEQQRAALEKLQSALMECETLDAHKLLSDVDQMSFDDLNNAVDELLSPEGDQ